MAKGAAMNQQNSVLEESWRRWVQSQLGADWKVIFAEEISGRDGPRPNGIFATLKFISGPRGHGHDDLISTDAGFSKRGHRGYTLSINAFGMGGMEALTDLQMRLDDDAALRDLSRDLSIGIVTRGDVLDVSGIKETGYERQYQMDVMFNAPREIAATTGAIESASVSGTLDGGSQGEQDIGPLLIERPGP
jgi:hypothetical protein